MARRIAGEKEHINETGRLTARPGSATEPALPPGLHTLGVASQRDALLWVPAQLEPGQAVPLVVMLHGAGGEAQHGLATLQHLTDATPFLLLVPPSRAQSWDIIVRHRYGPDIALIDAALKAVFVRFPVDTRHIALAGFSDGASYALSLGLMNGDLFTHLLAFAPGFMAPESTVGAPAIFVTHGTQDAVLPIDRCSRRLVPALQRAGYSVRYEEFSGPHTIPPALAQDALIWFLTVSG